MILISWPQIWKPENSTISCSIWSPCGNKMGKKGKKELTQQFCCPLSFANASLRRLAELYERRGKRRKGKSKKIAVGEILTQNASPHVAPAVPFTATRTHCGPKWKSAPIEMYYISPFNIGYKIESWNHSHLFAPTGLIVNINVQISQLHRPMFWPSSISWRHSRPTPFFFILSGKNLMIFFKIFFGSFSLFTLQ